MRTPFNEEVNAACRKSFDAFAMRAFKEVEPSTLFEWNWHIGCIAEHLEAVHRGEIRRLIINIMPRALKSYLVGRAFPAWEMGQDPSTKFICTSYGYEVAEQNALACRTMMKSPWYKSCFPDTLIGELDRNTHFTTTEAGQYYATSALSPITGIGCDYMIVDDPLKPMEALSDQVRNSTNENIRGTLFSRFNDKRNGKFIMVMQRLHEDDPTGHLLKDGGYTHLKLPVEAKKPTLIMLGEHVWTMAAGELLSPKRVDKKQLDQDMIDMGAYHFAAQMMQEPVPAGGGEFIDTWIQYYEPGGVKPRTMNIYILVDAAGGDEINKKKKKTSDWTAMMVVGLAPDNNYYLLDVVRDRLNPTERINKLFELHRKWNELSGKPPKVGYEKYGLMTDTHYIKLKQKEDCYRFPMVELGGRTSKEERIRAMIPDFELGRWYFPASLMYTDSDGRTMDLIQELVKSEMSSFPKARFDDMLDGLARSKDEKLGAVFPRLKKTEASREYEKRARDDNGKNWMDA